MLTISAMKSLKKRNNYSKNIRYIFIGSLAFYSFIRCFATSALIVKFENAQLIENIANITDSLGALLFLIYELTSTRE
jgi:hypothetical protein